jgi:hypothetical protein
MTKRLVRPSLEGKVYGNIERRLAAVERRKHGTLVYVGTYPTDPNTTYESVPFQNGWGNVGGNYPATAFCVGPDGFVHIEGAMTGGVDGTVAFTLPTLYCPPKSLRFIGALSSGSDFLTLQVDPTGDVTVVASGFVPGDGSVGVGKLAVGSGTDGQVLTIVAGAVEWATPASSVTANVTIRKNTANIGTRGAIDFHTGSVMSITTADDPANGEVDVTVDITPGTEGQVLTIVSGAVQWQDPIAPTPGTAVYPIVAVGGVGIGAEHIIDFHGDSIIAVTPTDTPGNKVELDFVIQPGGSGQYLQTIAGVVQWADPPTQARTVMLDWFGALPAAVGATQTLRVPYINGSLRTFTLQRLTLRVETTGSSATSITLQKSSAGSTFIPTSIGTASVGSGVNEDSETTSLGTVQSGDIVRVNFTAIGVGAASYLVQMEALEVV